MIAIVVSLQVCFYFDGVLQVSSNLKQPSCKKVCGPKKAIVKKM